MRRIVLGAENGDSGDGRVTCAPDASVSVGVTLVLPETRGEYERARAEVESLAGDAGGSEAGRPADTTGTIDTGTIDTNRTIGTNSMNVMPGAGCHHRGAAAGVGPS